MMALAANSYQRAIVFLVADIEEFVELESILPTHRDVWLHVVQLAEKPGEGDVSCIVKSCLAKDKYAILQALSVVRLGRWSRSCAPVL